jgi:predicted small integral membrane protein
MQNLANLRAALGFVSYVVSMDGHNVYPDHLGPALNSPVLAGGMLAIIIALELAAGALALRGAIDLLRARNATAEVFNAAKTYALAGTGLAVFLWFGIFSAIGGAYFQMWQTEAGANALQGAFQYAMLNGLVWMILRSDDS